jgi:hypothetical protein
MNVYFLNKLKLVRNYLRSKINFKFDNQQHKNEANKNALFGTNNEQKMR